jgi:hypothetical protein
MELRRSGKMTSKRWYAAALAALVLVIGLIALPRVGAAGSNDDLEFLQPPGVQYGEPDIPGHNRSVSVIRIEISNGSYRLPMFLVIPMHLPSVALPRARSGHAVRLLHAPRLRR